MNTKQFLKRIEELYASNIKISKSKNADYASNVDPFKNFRLCETLGITTLEKGILVRILDKVSRISNIIEKKEQVEDETIIDSLKDLANYSMILAVYLEKKSK